MPNISSVAGLEVPEKFVVVVVQTGQKFHAENVIKSLGIAMLSEIILD